MTAWNVNVILDPQASPLEASQLIQEALEEGTAFAHGEKVGDGKVSVHAAVNADTAGDAMIVVGDIIRRALNVDQAGICDIEAHRVR